MARTYGYINYTLDTVNMCRLAYCCLSGRAETKLAVVVKSPGVYVAVGCKSYHKSVTDESFLNTAAYCDCRCCRELNLACAETELAVRVVAPGVKDTGICYSRH